MTRFIVLFGLLVIAVGCVEHEQAPKLSEAETSLFRSQLLLAVEPPAASTVVEVRDAIADASAEQPEGELAVVGQIGGIPNPYGADAQPAFPWVDGQAVFFLVDPTTAVEFEGHQHEEGEECAFCMGKARDLVNTVAMVRLSGEGDTMIPARVDQLLDLEEGETVVVTGKARDELGMVVIDASGIHVRQAEPEAEETSEQNSAE